MSILEPTEPVKQNQCTGCALDTPWGCKVKSNNSNNSYPMCETELGSIIYVKYEELPDD